MAVMMGEHNAVRFQIRIADRGSNYIVVVIDCCAFGSSRTNLKLTFLGHISK